MKKFVKSRLFTFILGAVIFSGITGVVAYTLNANQVSYTPSDKTWKVKTVEEAINDMKENGTSKKFCELKSGTALAIGSKYECDPGDGVKKNFYVLEVRTDSVDLIMYKNISDGTMTWNNAMKYIESNNLKTTWKNVANVDLPKAQAIANAVGYSSWKAADSGATWWCLASHTQDSQSSPYCNTSQAQAYNWLYDYTRACNGCSNSLSADGQPYGYWTRDVVVGKSNAWNVYRYGDLDSLTVSNATYDGVRPVITVSKSNLSN